MYTGLGRAKVNWGVSRENSSVSFLILKVVWPIAADFMGVLDIIHRPVWSLYKHHLYRSLLGFRGGLDKILVHDESG